MAEVYFWDASALIKLYSKNEVGAGMATSLISGVENIHLTTWFVIYETLGVFKRKLLEGKVDEMGYQRLCEDMFDKINLNKITVDNVSLNSPQDFFSVRELRGNYPDLDYSDAIQLLAIKGTLKMSHKAFAKKFITADNSLADAATKEGLDVINLNDQIP